jgi:(1->4)-alpha-D-glucan 1-alpha-D-glucosylmutase
VLSEIPERWKLHLSRWSRINRGKRRQLESGNAPTRNDEYLIYQTLLGVWTPHDSAESLIERVQAYLVKATREAKRSTSWMNPNTEYETAIGEFAARLLEASEQNAFLRDFTSLAEIVTFFGHLNSLVQTILKLTSPGVPDTYQGTEAMSLALVDPDNRRPVDYESNRHLLEEFAALSHEEVASRLSHALISPHASNAKLFITWRLLQLRNELAEIFARGDYEPLQVNGAQKDHVMAFARTHERRSVIVVLAKSMAQLMKGELQAPLGEVWTDTSIVLTTAPGGPLRNLLSGTTIAVSNESALSAAELFKQFPFAVLDSRAA